MNERNAVLEIHVPRVPETRFEELRVRSLFTFTHNREVYMKTQSYESGTMKINAVSVTDGRLVYIEPSYKCIPLLDMVLCHKSELK